MEGLFAVTPKRDCPHCTDEHLVKKEALDGKHVKDPCADCGHVGENWICLQPGCQAVLCSRYVKSHMVAHQTEHPSHAHPIAFSFADFSYWCYACDSYIEHYKLDQSKHFYSQKFSDDETVREQLKKVKATEYKDELNEADEDDEEEKEEPTAAPVEEVKKDTVEELNKQLEDLKLDDKTLSYEKFVHKLKNGEFKKILVMTGAGISVSAGIPDFRSPKTGVYANLKEYDLPRPESLFAIDYFLDKPEAFYKFAKNFDLSVFDPSPTHYFNKMLQDKGLMIKYATQNIDNLEEKTEMNMKEVIQAHGANRGAHCAKCKADADPKKVADGISNFEVQYCDKPKCAGKQRPLKPNIVFFGESLPEEFRTLMSGKLLNEVDCLLVMGTALAVSPFNAIPRMLPKNVPQVLFNLEDTKETGGWSFVGDENKLFVEGKCDETLAKLVKECGWTEDFLKVLPEKHHSVL